MQIFLTDGHCRKSLFPFTEIRHTADIRVGIFTIKEKWEKLTGYKINLEADTAPGGNDICINANIIPTQATFQKIIDAFKDATPLSDIDHFESIKYPWHISQLNDWAIRNDFELINKGGRGETISASNKLLGGDNMFVAKGVKMELCMLNASEGPIYIGANAQIMEGSLLRGPIAICENAVIKMGSKIYGGTTIGPNCIAGGEIKNTVMFANSNKAHDGYLGDSVIAEWCNLGAGTSNSNLKNNAADVLFDVNGDTLNAGNKAGLMMGDYSRAAINTSFNTGTVVGVSCNIFGNEMPARFIPSFSWGKERYQLDKALRDIANWKKLKNKSLDEGEKLKLTELYTK